MMFPNANFTEQPPSYTEINFPTAAEKQEKPKTWVLMEKARRETRREVGYGET